MPVTVPEVRRLLIRWVWTKISPPMSYGTGRGGDGATQPQRGHATLKGANQICDCSTRRQTSEGAAQGLLMIL